ncbi:MAG: hypothetical protein V3T83_15830 [Acidobacteriota bacterium]
MSAARTHRVETWLSDTERLCLRRLADLEGRSMSAMLRQAMLAYIEALRQPPVERR